MTSDIYFDKGHHIDRYYYLEEDLVKFLQYVNLDFYNAPQKREFIKSTYLADLMIRIGSNIDIFFNKIITSKYPEIIREKELKFQGKKVEIKFEDYKLINERFVKGYPVAKLSNTRVRIIQTGESIIPFENWTNQDPKWWRNYNEVKHRALFNKADLDNVINALAALLLLICFEKNSRKMIQYNYLCINPSAKSDILRDTIKEFHHDIVTKIFIPSIQS